jgi:hypothetical protein
MQQQWQPPHQQPPQQQQQQQTWQAQQRDQQHGHVQQGHAHAQAWPLQHGPQQRQDQIHTWHAEAAQSYSLQQAGGPAAHGHQQQQQQQPEQQQQPPQQQPPSQQPPPPQRLQQQQPLQQQPLQQQPPQAKQPPQQQQPVQQQLPQQQPPPPLPMQQQQRQQQQQQQQPASAAAPKSLFDRPPPLRLALTEWGLPPQVGVLSTKNMPGCHASARHATQTCALACAVWNHRAAPQPTQWAADNVKRAAQVVAAYADKGVKELYRWQAAALEQGERGENLVYCAPTSGEVGHSSEHATLYVLRGWRGLGMAVRQASMLVVDCAVAMLLPRPWKAIGCCARLLLPPETEPLHGLQAASP